VFPDTPRVTVVIAAYNEERFIAHALDSALGQDYPADRVAVIVVDDGSTDATARVAERHAAATGRLRVIRQRSGGNVAATNAGLARADGDVVALLDADDVWAPDHLSKSIQVLRTRPEVGLVYGDMTVVDADGKVLQESWLAGDVTPEGRCAGAQLTGNNVTASSIVMRASVLREAVPIPAGMPWADWWLAVRVAQVSELAYLAEPRTRYRFHGTNMSLGAEGDARRRPVAVCPRRRDRPLERARPRRARPALAAAPGGEKLPGQQPLAGAASFVVLATAQELIGSPALLRAYADGMRDTAGVTLAVDASAMDAATAGDSHESDARLARPTFGAGEIAALRRLVSR
jgi:hypothetical protein